MLGAPSIVPAVGRGYVATSVSMLPLVRGEKIRLQGRILGKSCASTKLRTILNCSTPLFIDNADNSTGYVVIPPQSMKV